MTELDQIRQMLESHIQAAKRAQEVAGELEAWRKTVTVQGGSNDGRVVVEVNGLGHIVGVRCREPEAYDPSEAAAALTEALHNAQTELAALLAERAAAADIVFVDDDSVLEATDAYIDQLFGPLD